MMDNNKMYLLTKGQYSDHGIVGVFSTKERAERMKEMLGGYDNEINDPEEIEIDKGYDEIEKGMSIFEVYMDRSGNVSRVHEVGTEEFGNAGNIGTLSGGTFVITLFAMDGDQAIKAANEKRAQKIAEETGQ